MPNFTDLLKLRMKKKIEDKENAESGLPEYGQEEPEKGQTEGYTGQEPKVVNFNDLGNNLIEQTALEQPIGKKEIAKAVGILRDYKAGKENLEAKIIENEKWYKMRHWDVIRGHNKNNSDEARPEPSSAWLFNSLMNKHADAMDNYPEPNVLPRERGDEEDAKTLSSILPVIIERNEFEDTYSDAWWYKLKHGTSCYGVFWNKELENGLGDIDIHNIDLLNVFWEPGITDIQKSSNLFIVDLVDNELLKAQYPQLTDKTLGSVIDVKQYNYDDNVDVSNKSLVVDWYYKIKNESGKTVLHYCKFVGSELLFASENDSLFTERGWYDHGKYPIFMDTLFPNEGTPAGFGYLDIMKDAQIYIDKLNQAMMENALMTIKPRYWASQTAGVNEDEFLDWSKPICHVTGTIDDSKLKQITVPTLSGNYITLLEDKVNEIKETSSNRDFSQGSSASGVTAASAIAALQEAGNKTSRDMIAQSYRTYTNICYLCIELIRQFYDETRSFRITGNGGHYDFVDFNNQDLQGKPMPKTYVGDTQSTRVPIFDVVIKAQKKNPFSRASQNETAKELYNMGFFNPEQAQPSLIALDMMEFEGKDKIVEKVNEGQTLMNIVQQQQSQLQQMSMILQGLTGQGANVDSSGQMDMGAQQQKSGGGGGVNAKSADAQQEQAPYTQKVVKNSTPNMNAQGGKVQ